MTPGLVFLAVNRVQKTLDNLVLPVFYRTELNKTEQTCLRQKQSITVSKDMQP
jgi:hypothetical protein